MRPFSGLAGAACGVSSRPVSNLLSAVKVFAADRKATPLGRSVSISARNDGAAAPPDAGPIHAVAAVRGVVRLRRSADAAIVGSPLTPSPSVTTIPVPATIVRAAPLDEMQSNVTPF